MASSDLALKQEWYEIVDLFLGPGRDWERALARAATCAHPDAQWLVRACDGKDVSTKEGARDCFLAVARGRGNEKTFVDGKALLFAVLFCDVVNEDMLIQSAELSGWAFAQAQVARWMWQEDGDIAFKYATKSALQHERDGSYWLAFCFEHGIGCEIAYDKALEQYVFAAQMRHVSSMLSLAWFFDEADPKHWYWLGEAAVRGATFHFLSVFEKQVKTFETDVSGAAGLAPSIFVIGRYLHGRINVEKETIFGDTVENNQIEPGNRAVEFFTAQCRAAREAVDQWTLLARSLGVVKDIRLLVAKMIWGSRESALYTLKN